MFRIEATKQAALLKVSYIGFEEQIIPIQEGKTDMGIIKLSDSNLSLSEITVVGHKPLVSMEKGVLTTGVANSLLSSLGTAEVKNHNKQETRKWFFHVAPWSCQTKPQILAR